MGKFKGIFLVGVLMFSTLMLITNPLQYCSGVQAYYTDIKSLGGCSITAPAQILATQASNCTIIDDGKINGVGGGENAKKFWDFGIKNSDLSKSITITDIQVYLTTIPVGTTVKVTHIGFDKDKTNFFTSSANLGDKITGTPAFILTANKDTTLNIDFDTNMHAMIPITLKFTFGDGSAKTVVVNPK